MECREGNLSGCEQTGVVEQQLSCHHVVSSIPEDGGVVGRFWIFFTAFTAGTDSFLNSDRLLDTPFVDQSCLNFV